MEWPTVIINNRLNRTVHFHLVDFGRRTLWCCDSCALCTRHSWPNAMGSKLIPKLSIIIINTINTIIVCASALATAIDRAEKRKDRTTTSRYSNFIPFTTKNRFSVFSQWPRHHRQQNPNLKRTRSLQHFLILVGARSMRYLFSRLP